MILRRCGVRAFRGRLQIRRETAEALTELQIQEFLKGSQGIVLEGPTREERYRWVQAVLVAQDAVQGKKRRGTVRAYLSKVTGLSLPQLTRLIRQYRTEGVVLAAAYRRRRFPSKYNRQDIALLAELDRAHHWLSGPATVHTRIRATGGHLGGASVQSAAEHELPQTGGPVGAHTPQGGRHGGTAQARSSRTARLTPRRHGASGGLERGEGVYHINAVDTMTQWQVVGCVGRINEQHILPVLEAMLHQFPLRILGFHSDNGSEYVNYEVAKMLKTLRIEFTQCRANRTQDKALGEGKNGASIRKHMGYGHIAGEHARGRAEVLHGAIEPLPELRRPCGFATVSLDARGKRRRQYKRNEYATRTRNGSPCRKPRNT
jgi:transposase InsO family protein